MRAHRRSSIALVVLALLCGTAHSVHAASASGNSDELPSIWIAGLPNGTMARPSFHLAAACQDDLQCVSLTVTAAAAQEISSVSYPVCSSIPQQTLASDSLAIDRDVSLAAFEGCAVFLYFVATDSAGQHTTAMRYVFVDSNPRYIETVHVSGHILDDSATRTLFSDGGRLSVYDKGTQQITVIGFFLAVFPNQAYLTPGGVIYQWFETRFDEQGHPYQIPHLNEWRSEDETVTALDGWYLLQVKGGYALWVAATGLIRKDLVNNTTQTIVPGPGPGSLGPRFPATLAANGDVVFLDGPSGAAQIVRYRDGVVSPLTFDSSADYGGVLTDGVNVVAKRYQSLNQTLSIQLITPAGESTLTTFPSTPFPDIVQGSDYQVVNGWVAYKRAGGNHGIDVRAPDGTVNALDTPAGWTSIVIAKINDDGRTAVAGSLNGRWRLVVGSPGGTPIEVGGRWGTVFSHDGQLYTPIGGSIMRVITAACTTGTLSSTSAHAESGGGTVTIDVTAGPDCVWGVLSNSLFATVTSLPAGTGNGTVTISVAPSAMSLARRGQVTIAGQTLTIVQDGRAAVAGDFTGGGSASRAVFRPANGMWYVEGQTPRQFGVPGDIPVAGDYNGDRVVDPAVYRPSTGEWFIADQPTVQAGPFTGIPVPADYDGNGATDIAYYDTQTQLAVWKIDGQPDRQFGLSSDVPRPADLDGDGRADLVVYRRPTGEWFVSWSSTNYTSWTRYQWGLPGDVPLTADVDGDGRADLIVYRPSLGRWYISFAVAGFTTSATRQWGLSGDIPLAIDRNGDARAELCVFRPWTGEWFCYDMSSGTFDSAQYGLAGDIAAMRAPRSPVVSARDADGDGVVDATVYRRATGEWYALLSSTGFQNATFALWGVPGDREAPGDYDGDGRMDTAVFRTSEGRWYGRNSSNGAGWSYSLGLTGDVPVAADYDGDGRTDLAVFRPQTGEWFVLLSSSGFTRIVVTQWGLSGDTAVPADYDGDGRVDYGVFRPSQGVWYVLLSGANYATALVLNWGAADETPMPADVDGDGRADLVLLGAATGQWRILESQFGYSVPNVRTAIGFQAGDLPVIGDYDGDGRSDLGRYRPTTGQWVIALSSRQNTSWSFQWGKPGDDVPLDRQ